MNSSFSSEIDINDYFNEEQFQQILSLSKQKQTPFLIIHLEKVKEKIKIFNNHYKNKNTNIFYAVKANPHPKILQLLNQFDCCFDIASKYELDQLLDLAIAPEKISFGNTIKKKADIGYAFKKGVNIFACDNFDDLKNISEYAPNSKVFFRIAFDGLGSDWPLSNKFGAHLEKILELVIKATSMNIIPYGLSFHVGSQQRDIGQWDGAIKQARYLFNQLKKKKIYLKMLNIGGGFPSNYLPKSNSLQFYLQEINRYLENDFGDIENLKIFVEPGRGIVGDSGVIVTEVISVQQKLKSDLHKWAYLDIGVFNGLIETLGEAIKYPIYKEKPNSAYQNFTLAGPTCDSMDVMYQQFQYSLPSDLKSGDKLFILSTGAYTTTYSSNGFNGFPPLKSYFI